MGCPGYIMRIIPADPPPQGPYPAPAKEWSRTFGGPYRDEAHSVQQTACGGFIITGRTESFGAGESDFWLVKMDPEGNKQWSRTFGGPKSEEAYSVQQTACGGFIVAGTIDQDPFFGGDTDFWLLKLAPEH